MSDSPDKKGRQPGEMTPEERAKFKGRISDLDDKLGKVRAQHTVTHRVGSAGVWSIVRAGQALAGAIGIGDRLVGPPTRTLGRRNDAASLLAGRALGAAHGTLPAAVEVRHGRNTGGARQQQQGQRQPLQPRADQSNVPATPTKAPPEVGSTLMVVERRVELR